MAILILQHSDSCTPGLLGASLRRHGQRTRLVRVAAGEALPPDLDDVHGVISLGGPQSANDTAPWVAAELALLKEAHDARVPVLGICLGAQMLARALGGEVGRMPRAEIGWVEVQNTAVDKEDPLLAGLPWTRTVFAWHNECVARPPEGATILQRNAACAVQAYRVGAWTYGIQYHPEWNRDTILAEIAGATAEELAAAGASAEALRQATAEHAPTAERHAERMFEACNTVLFPASALQPGLAARSPLHH
jgi:GMP synthase-like glutamine amidotransferase